MRRTSTCPADQNSNLSSIFQNSFSAVLARNITIYKTVRLRRQALFVTPWVVRPCPPHSLAGQDCRGHYAMP